MFGYGTVHRAKPLVDTFDNSPLEWRWCRFNQSALKVWSERAFNCEAKTSIKGMPKSTLVNVLGRIP